jgi:hypothetical protein
MAFAVLACLLRFRPLLPFPSSLSGHARPGLPAPGSWAACCPRPSKRPWQGILALFGLLPSPENFWSALKCFLTGRAQVPVQGQSKQLHCTPEFRLGPKKFNRPNQVQSTPMFGSPIIHISPCLHSSRFRGGDNAPLWHARSAGSMLDPQLIETMTAVRDSAVIFMSSLSIHVLLSPLARNCSRCRSTPFHSLASLPHQPFTCPNPLPLSSAATPRPLTRKCLTMLSSTSNIIALPPSMRS